MFLGIDIGTSEVKVLLLDESHQVLATKGVPLSLSRPQHGYAEQDPRDWWAATLQALGQLREHLPTAFAAIKAIGLSGQMHGAVLLDAHHKVLRPAILWNDTRCDTQCQEMMAAMPHLPDVAGSLAMPGFTAPKLRWVAQHEPDIFAQVAKVLLPKDYIRWCLTGDYATDQSDASGTLWLDVAKRQWSDELLDISGLNRTHMPRLLEGSEAGGTVLPAIAQQMGWANGVVVAGGGGDNAASAVGMGTVQAGQGFVSLGTSGVIFVVTSRFQPNAASATHAFCHALPQRWHQMSVMLSAASALQWLRGLLGAESEGALLGPAGQLDAAQRQASPLFLPYLGGERTPHNDAQVRGSFHGLDFNTDSARLAYSVMEGVTFGLRDGWLALQQAGCHIERFSLVGGGARSALWAQQLASALDTQIVTHTSSAQGGALGAARLGWLATGAHVDDVCQTPDIAHRFYPDPIEQALLLQRHQQFRQLYAQRPVLSHTLTH